MTDSINRFPSLQSLVMYGVKSDSIQKISLRRLKIIDFRAVSLGVELSKFLNQQEQLEYLAILDTSLTERVLSSLGSLKSLRYLNLNGSEFENDQLLDALKQLELQELSLHNTSVTDREVATIARQRRLNTLNVSKSSVTDASMPTIASMSQLKVLDISDTSVSDRGVFALAKSKSLHTLRLHGISVTTAIIAALTGMRRLETVVLPESFSEEAIKKARRLMPKVCFYQDY